jgi:hypothetical protein
MTAIPTSETITPEWIGEQIRLHGHGDDVVVHAFEAERIGTGQIGKCIRYTLDLEGGGRETPKSLVGKFASDDPTSRATGMALNSFIKEVSFYQKLQGRVRIETPDCYYAAIDGNGPDFMLLLQDLAPARQGDQLAGCDARVASRAVGELVGLHAPSWCDPDMRAHEWLGEPTADAVAFAHELYTLQLPAFLERFRDRIEPDEADIITRMAESESVWQLSDGLKTLIHVDYRLDNLLINEETDPPFVCAVDWQSITVGNPLSDVAYFMGAGMLPEDRRLHEAQIVETYWSAMCDAGIAEYDFKQCWKDYRRGTFAGFVVTVVAAPMVEQTERGDEMFTVMARRHARHALDLDADEFL